MTGVPGEASLVEPPAGLQDDVPGRRREVLDVGPGPVEGGGDVRGAPHRRERHRRRR
jgi:hypothetical protein